MFEDRYKARKDFLRTPECAQLLQLVGKNVGRWYPCCLVGGLAVTHHANPPSTMDVDILVDCIKEDAQALINSFERWEARPLWFPGRQKGIPQHGLQLRSEIPGFPAEIDLLFAGTDKYLKSVVARAVKAFFQDGGVEFRVITAEDLVVMKSLVGRDKDMADIQELYNTVKGLDVEYVNKQIDRMM